MNRNDIVAWLEALGAKVPNNQPRSSWIVSDCVFGNWRHDNGKSTPDAFGVRLDSGVPFVNCFSCGYHGDMDEALLEIKHAEKRQPSGTPRDFETAGKLLEKAANEFDLDLSGPDLEEWLTIKATMHDFSEEWLASFKPVVQVAPGRMYLKSRGVPEDVAEALDLRWDSGERRVCFPVRDFKGALRGLHGRATIDGVEPRYRMYSHQDKNNPLIWLGEHWIELDKPILVVEGPFDVASAVRVYRNTCSPLFANPSYDKIQRMGDALDVVTLLDRGKAGDLGRIRFSKSLPGSKVINLIPPPQVEKDPGAMSVEQLQDLLGPYLELDAPVF
jgi:hypothetical protein